MNKSIALLLVICIGIALLLWQESCREPIEVEKVVTKEVVKFIHVPGPERFGEVDRIIEKIVEKPVIVEKVVKETIEVPTYVYEVVEVPVDRVVDRIVDRIIYVDRVFYVEVMPCWRGRRR